MSLPQIIVDYYTLYYFNEKEKILSILDTHSFTKIIDVQISVIFVYNFKCSICNQTMKNIFNLNSNEPLNCDEMVVKNILE